MQAEVEKFTEGEEFVVAVRDQWIGKLTPRVTAPTIRVLNMPAILNLDLVRHRAETFPNGEHWQSIQSSVFVADRDGGIFSTWQPAGHVNRVGGVYAILLPVAWFMPHRTIHLHAPQTHEDKTIPYQFTVPNLTADGYGVVYVGRSSNLCQRWQGHLSRGYRKDGGQVKFGLCDCGLHADIDAALRALRQHARITYTILEGAENCANRDVLEMALCARFGPPFNIKSER